MASINYLTLKPEQAHKIYEEYVKEDKPLDALNILFRYLSSFGQRNRVKGYQEGDVSVASNIQTLQKLMTAYIDLRLLMGVNLAEEQAQMKEVLKSYRQMTQHNHPEAFFDLLDQYQAKVATKFNEQVKQYALEDLQKLPFVGQLSYEEPAEDLLYLSFDPEAKIQKDAQKSCLRLLWEAYRTIMENVKWNEKMEELYFKTIKLVCDFCLTYRRRAEFQWFCEQINRFVGDINVRDIDIRKNPSHVDLSKATTNDKHVVARFDVVKTAMQLDMMQEAFKALETITILKNMRKGTFRTSYLLLYFEMLSHIFDKSQHELYRAFAYYHHFLAFRKKPVKDAQEQQQKLLELNEKLNYLVMCVLVIPLNKKDTGNMQLFGQGNKIPSREELLKILGEMNAIQSCTPVVRRAYALLEGKQDLLSIADQSKQLFIDLSPVFPQFIKQLEENIIQSVLKNIAGIYKTIKFSSLESLLKFSTQERIIQALLSQSCQLDFLSQIVHFPTEQISQLPNIISQFPVTVHLVDPVDAARKFLQASDLEMLTRQQIISRLNKQSDPNQIKQEQNEEKERRKQEESIKRKAEDEKRKFEEKCIQEMEQRKAKELNIRRKLVDDIIKLKGSKFVTFEIYGERKKIELLKDHHLMDIDTTFLQDIKKKFEEESKKGADDKYIRGFKRVDYIERERCKLEAQIKLAAPDVDLQKIQAANEQRYLENKELKVQLQDAFAFVQDELASYEQACRDKYEGTLAEWRELVKKKYLDEIIKQAANLQKKDEDEKAKQALLAKQAEEQRLKYELENKDKFKDTPSVKFERGTGVAAATEIPAREQPQQAKVPFTGTLARSTVTADQQQPQQQAPQTQAPAFTNNRFAALARATPQEPQAPPQQAPKQTPQPAQQAPLFQRGIALTQTAPQTVQPPAQTLTRGPAAQTKQPAKNIELKRGGQ